MPAERLPMRRIKEIIRLSWDCGLSARQIARSLKVARSTVAEYLGRARVAGLSWPLPEELDEEVLERKLFPALDPRFFGLPGSGDSSVSCGRGKKFIDRGKGFLYKREK